MYTLDNTHGWSQLECDQINAIMTNFENRLRGSDSDYAALDASELDKIFDYTFRACDSVEDFRAAVKEFWAEKKPV